uniref:Uncharacterized protein n=1 Tax=Utricularia reniformis TaxID=192314 RepID=A0A1Y0B1I8_9LAMI|nr:hypothetical protein AEK19_MT1095 [Utricularia reniformis]ART31315.1 hypothetical protein AEK19_MT1095 [Utricularia reniformis]
MMMINYIPPFLKEPAPEQIQPSYFEYILLCEHDESRRRRIGS